MGTEVMKYPKLAGMGTELVVVKSTTISRRYFHGYIYETRQTTRHYLHPRAHRSNFSNVDIVTVRRASSDYVWANTITRQLTRNFGQAYLQR